jgi:group I intron endonuclease
MIEVYCHTSPSGKRYVGYSTHGMAERWRRHVEFARAGSRYLVHRAIRKYGEDAFQHVVLAQCTSEDEAKAVEVECIAAAGSLAPHGYNATSGGEGIKAACPEVREKLRASFTPERRAAIGALRAELNAGNTYGTANRGKKRTPESRAKMAERARGNKSHAGCTHSDEARAKMSAAVRAHLSDPAARLRQGDGNRGKPWSAARRAAHERRG